MLSLSMLRLWGFHIYCAWRDGSQIWFMEWWYLRGGFIRRMCLFERLVWRVCPYGSSTKEQHNEFSRSTVYWIPSCRKKGQKMWTRWKQCLVTHSTQPWPQTLEVNCFCKITLPLTRSESCLGKPNNLLPATLFYSSNLWLLLHTHYSSSLFGIVRGVL